MAAGSCGDLASGKTYEERDLSVKNTTSTRLLLPTYMHILRAVPADLRLQHLVEAVPEVTAGQLTRKQFTYLSPPRVGFILRGSRLKLTLPIVISRGGAEARNSSAESKMLGVGAAKGVGAANGVGAVVTAVLRDAARSTGAGLEYELRGGGLSGACKSGVGAVSGSLSGTSSLELRCSSSSCSSPSSSDRERSGGVGVDQEPNEG
jgi:hypothetical protein